MNTKILAKVLEELTKDKPDISYVRGMIEVLLASVEIPVVAAAGPPNILQDYRSSIMPLTDEAAELDAKAKVAIATIGGLQEATVE